MQSSVTTPRIVVTDVDGTVIGKSGVASDAAAEAVASAHAAGWHVALATGRMIERVRPVATQLAIPVVICTEGSLIYSLAEERPLLAHLVPPPIIAEALGMLESESWQYALVTAEAIYARSPQFADLFSPWGSSVQPIEDRPADCPVLMLVAFGLYEEMEQLYQEWQARFDQAVQLIHEHTSAPGPGGGLVKILNPRSDKGQSALWLAEYLGLIAGDIIAFGDWLNDFSLLNCAALSIVPDNAVPEIKALADHISPYDVDQDFFARELNRLLDARVGPTT